MCIEVVSRLNLGRVSLRNLTPLGQAEKIAAPIVQTFKRMFE